MSGSGGSVLSDLSQVYTQYQEDIKRLYLTNQRLTYAPPDTRTETNLLEVLERTDNVCAAVQAGNHTEARRELDRLEAEMQNALCQAALFGPEQQLAELRRRRFGSGLWYAVTGLRDQIDVAACRQTERQMEQRLEQARSLDSTRCRQCDQVSTTIEQKLENIPARSAVRVRLLLITAALITVGGLVASFV